MASLADPSVFPFCNPDWDNTDFVASVVSSMRPLGTDNIDFPCNMSIGKAMSLPILCATVALAFTAVLYKVLINVRTGPGTDEDVEELGTYKDPAEVANNQKDYPVDKCPIPKKEQVAIGKAMNKISAEVQDGAKAFLVEEYKWLSAFVVFMFCTLLVLFTLDDNRTDRTDGIRMAACFLVGAFLSATAGWVGMQVATDANVRTTQAARNVSSGGDPDGGLNRALRVAFNGGAVMGFVVVGLGLLGVSIFMLIMSKGRDCEDYRQFGFVTSNTAVCDAAGMEDGLDSLAGFGFGASSIALFARVAGGIYTKAADVGADLVGKVEEDIPEDSPENPATIADNVGDNVGDVAGMGADLFESFVGSIIACATLANGDIAKIALPFWLAGAGVVASIVGFFCVSIGEEKAYHLNIEDARNRDECNELMFEEKLKLDSQTQSKLKYPYFVPQDKDGKSCDTVWRHDQPEDDEDDKHLAGSGPVFDDYAQQADLMMALHKGTLSSSLLVCGFAALICYLLFDWSEYQENQQYYYAGGPEDKDSEAWRIYGCILIGLLCGILIGVSTEYATSYSYYPVKSISNSGVTGPATVIIQGLGVGMMSCFPPTFIIVATILACNALMAEYGVAVAAVSMLSTLGVTLATDAYGPIADNAGGLAEMVEELPSAVRRTTDALDALGNTTAATGKGFAIGSAVLTALSLLNAFEDRVTSSAALDLSVNDSIVLAGIVFGSMLPFLFGALTMISVGLAAQELIRAVRKDFVDKKAEEVAAIESGKDGKPYKPWEFMNGKYLSLDAEEQKLLGNGADKASYEYYMKTVAGTAQDRKEFLEKGLEGGASAMTPDGLRGVVLKNVTLHNRGADSSAPAGSSNEEGKHAINVVDVVDGGRWHDTTPQDQAGVCDLSQEPVKAENVANEPGRWAERQSVFATHKWHGIRGWAPNSKECIRISTQASIREMMLPGVYAIFTPVFVGFLIGARMLMGVLAGSVGAGAMLAIMMANAGGAWDNSKKYIEIAGAKGGKGTDTHKACVVGDTVGDPFKDTSGPSLNILLKLMAMVSLTIATLLKGQDDWEIGWFAFIPGVIILGATFYYCKYIYGAAEEEGKKAEVTSATQPDSPKKQTWHVEAATNAQGEVEHGYFKGNPTPAAQV